MPLSCRFYKEKYPEVENVVMVNVRSIAEMGYIDLSKRRVSAEDVEKCTERFAKAKAVNSILRHVAELLHYETDEQLEELYQKTAWHFEDKLKKKASAYDFFKQAVLQQPEGKLCQPDCRRGKMDFYFSLGLYCHLVELLANTNTKYSTNRDPSILAECGLDDETKKVLLKNIIRKLTSHAVKIRADIEVACYGYEGIDAVKAALRAGLACSTEELLIKINLIAPPLYVMTTSSPEKQDGLKALAYAIEKIEETITTMGGVFQIQMAPKVVTATDEAELARQMERAEMENAEVAGDDDEEEIEGQVFSAGEGDEEGEEGEGEGEEVED